MTHSQIVSGRRRMKWTAASTWSMAPQGKSREKNPIVSAQYSGTSCREWLLRALRPPGRRLKPADRQTAYHEDTKRTKAHEEILYMDASWPSCFFGLREEPLSSNAIVDSAALV